jgi:hypothetical protein
VKSARNLDKEMVRLSEWMNFKLSFYAWTKNYAETNIHDHFQVTYLTIFDFELNFSNEGKDFVKEWMVKVI